MLSVFLDDLQMSAIGMSVAEPGVPSVVESDEGIIQRASCCLA